MYFIDAIRMLCPLSAESERRLVEVTTPCRFPKRYQLVRDGEFCHSAYFLEQGMTRSFWVVDGEEVTTSFSSEGGIVFSMDELYYGRRSEEVVETLEETSARRIALDDLRTLFRTNLELANWGLIIHQNEYRRLHRSHKERLTRSRPRSATKPSAGSFPTFADGPSWATSPPTWASRSRR